MTLFLINSTIKDKDRSVCACAGPRLCLLVDHTMSPHPSDQLVRKVTRVYNCFELQCFDVTDSLPDWKGHLLCCTAKISKIFFRHTYSWSNVGVGDQKPRYFCGDGTSYKKKEKRAIRYGHQPLYLFHLFSVKLLRSARWRNRKTRFSELVFGILMTTFHAALLFQKTISDTAFDMYA